MKKVINSYPATTVEEFIDALKELTVCFHRDQVYITINSDSVLLSLVQEKLTDGSIVHNVELSEVSK